MQDGKIKEDFISNNFELSVYFREVVTSLRFPVSFGHLWGTKSDAPQRIAATADSGGVFEILSSEPRLVCSFSICNYYHGKWKVSIPCNNTLKKKRFLSF